MRSIFTASSLRRGLTGLILAMTSAFACLAQQQVNAVTQINWFAATGAGAPTTRCPTTITGNVTNLSKTVTGVSSFTGVVGGQVVVGSDVPSGTFTGPINGIGSTLTLSQAATATTSGATLSLYSYGAVYTDTTNNVVYVCGSSGWIELGSGGAGTVTSVALTLPAIFSVGGSPITTSGTLAGALATQTANLVFASPSSGSAAQPTFRALAAADFPTSGVTAGSYTSASITVDAKGRVTAASSGNAAPCSRAFTPSLVWTSPNAGSLESGSTDCSGAIDISSGNVSGGTVATATFGGTYSSSLFCIVHNSYGGPAVAFVNAFGGSATTFSVATPTGAAFASPQRVTYICD